MTGTTEVKKARVVYIKEHFLLLCKKDLVKALILDRLVYYFLESEKVYAHLEDEIRDGANHKLDMAARGWTKKSASFLADSLLVGESERTIQRKLEELYNLGYLDRKRQEGEAYWYRPHMAQIKKNLGLLGYDLDGNPVNNKGGTNEQSKPPDKDKESYQDKQRTEFAEIPSVSKAGDDPQTFVAKIKEGQNWAAQFECLDNAPPEVRDVSKLIAEKTGFEPNKGGKDANWIAAVTALWGAAGKNKTNLIEALEEGNKRRMDPQKPLTFGSPRSYVKYAQDVVARKKLKQAGHTPARIQVGQTNGTNHKPTKGEKIRIGIQSLAA